MKPFSYLAIFISSLIVLSALTVLINYKIDPYLIFNSPRIDNLNQYKTDINSHIRGSKAYHPTYYEWDALIIGNSRVEMGLNPEHECFKERNLNVYNLGIPGAGVREQLEFALNIIHNQPIKQVFLSVDFLDFLVKIGERSKMGSFNWSEPPVNKSLRYSFDGTLNSEWHWESFKDKYRSLYSLDALTSSIKTVMMQSDSRANRTQKGFNPANDFRASTEIEGVNAIFEQKINSLDKRLANEWDLYYEDGSTSRAFLALEKFIDITQKKGIELTIFTNPFHEKFWDLLKRKKLYYQHQEWINRLVQMLNQKNLSNIQFWDFSGDSIYIHEAIPKSIKYTPLNWFWEPSHYRKELGDLMIESMRHLQCGKSIKFGERIF